MIEGVNFVNNADLDLTTDAVLGESGEKER